MLYQAGRTLHSIDEARPRDGDVRDTFGRVAYRAMVSAYGFAWLFVGEHTPIRDAHQVMH